MHSVQESEQKRVPFHEEFAQKIIEGLKNGTAPFIKPWEAGISAASFNMESGKMYRGVNHIEGRSCRPRSREEALALIRKAQAYRLSFDIGIMQVNSWWLRRFGLSAEQMLHPQNNVLVGVHILAQEIRRHA